MLQISTERSVERWVIVETSEPSLGDGKDVSSPLNLDLELLIALGGHLRLKQSSSAHMTMPLDAS